MPHKRPNLERQLAHAKQDLDACTGVLDKQGVVIKQRRRDPVWRELNARWSRLKSRLRFAAAVTALTEEVIKRKAEPRVKKSKTEPRVKAKKSGVKADAKKSSGGEKKKGAKGGKKKK